MESYSTKEQNGSSSILDKWNKLRRKPQQPLSDLSELYSKVANEIIYYKQLQDSGHVKKALQGWKALTTDIMFRLTLIDHRYPNLQYYRPDELSLLTGVKELYQKADKHLEQAQDIIEKHPELNVDTDSHNKVYYSTDHKKSLTRMQHSVPLSSPPLQQQQGHQNHGFSRTTLRTQKPYLHSYSISGTNQQDHNQQRQNQQPQHQVKVNFSQSKPLNYSSRSLRSENDVHRNRHDDTHKLNLFDVFDTDNILEEDETPQPQQQPILIESSDEAGEHYEEDDNSNDFDVSDYYDNYLEVNGEDLARFNALDRLNGETTLHDQMKDLTVSTPPELPKLPPLPSAFPPLVPKTLAPPPAQSVPPPDIGASAISAPVLNAVRSRGPINKKHNLMNKCNSVTPPASAPALPSRPTPQGAVKLNNSTPALNTTVMTSGTHASNGNKSKPAVLKKTSTKSSSSLPTKVTKQALNLEHPQKLPQTISASQVAQLVYNGSTSNPPVRKGKPMMKKNVVSRERLKTETKNPTVTKTRTSIKPVVKKPATEPNLKTGKPTSTNMKKKKSATATPPQNTPPPPPANVTKQPQGKEVDNAEEDKVDSKDADEERLINSIPGIDKALAKQILQDIVVHGDEVHWEDIAGLNSAKNSLKEAVVYPFLRPDLFLGLREPVTGMLLFGPPGTGKTMLARAVACESHSTFFSISASSLTSKYLGESEKLVRALFMIAQRLAPSIIFVDEIDSLLGSRNQDGENESSRRIKNEFLVQWSALSSAAAGKQVKTGSKAEDKRVLVLAATNLPWSIDEAARRRFVRRQYIPLPESETRRVQFEKLLSYQIHSLTSADFEELVKVTQGYSGSDITSLAKDAAMGPLRELGDQLLLTDRDEIRAVTLGDFTNSLEYIKPSVSKEGLSEYENWALHFGSSGT
ncbi:putative AAA family ATPase SAP1 KNAG_0L01320 [Huiozyma naganishii CBS 8797]|uniref:AAA+ ATPase domain-containing protein n=1 Tax=Huiozyma naganishii (strain ATCC MYA-139 / BCRC 22969 / CBS 8797 / KCTC 17520 / NBRC 10181 / NCYC 3082 / Yp74L-3) TaxID=1071383 RepID=J7S3P9_HUIN7|nr:hypothetical protein KNAG_0L01320 [Kazachstania naganishii CBS 8797]CCK72752.1 hypothetical protein KNAG_0L01320 [Kazachstania naganishii CBS 8797]